MSGKRAKIQTLGSIFTLSFLLAPSAFGTMPGGSARVGGYYPPCTRERTDSCIQTERVIRDMRGGPGDRRGGQGGSVHAGGGPASDGPGAPVQTGVPPGGAAHASTPESPAQAAGGTAAGGTSFNSAQEKYNEDKLSAFRVSEEANNQALSERRMGRLERDLATAIANDADRINREIRPQLSSPDPQIRSQANQALGQSATPPAQLAHYYEQGGLRTNQDVMVNGESYVENLAAASKTHDALAEDLEDKAAKARRAAMAMENFEKTLGERTTNLASLSENTIVSKAPAAAAKPLARQAKRAVDTEDDSTIVGRGNGSLLTQAGSSGFGKKDSSSASSVSGDRESGLSTTKGNNKIASLSEKLRKSLAAASTADRERAARDGNSGGGRAPASTFETFFPEKGSAAPGASGGSPIEAQSGKYFQMSQAETEAQVKKLVDSLNGQANSDEAKGERDVYGSSDITIFARMKTYLTKAQQEKRL